MINTQQIIVMLPLFNISTPHNLEMVFKILMDIAAFDILPTDDIFGLVYKVEHTDPLSANFEAMGFESLWLIYNLGTLFLIALSIPIFMALLPAFKLISFYFSCSDKVYEGLKKMLFWNYTIRILTESYTILIIGCMISSTSLIWTNFAYSFNSGLVYLFYFILIGYPPLILYYMNKHYD